MTAAIACILLETVLKLNITVECMLFLAVCSAMFALFFYYKTITTTILKSNVNKCLTILIIVYQLY